MKKKSSMPRFPWITEDGYFDLTKFPIDGILKQSLSPDITQFESACRTLGAMVNNGRIEAGVYLVGLFNRFRGDLMRLTIIVKQLPEDSQSAELLMAELYRVKSSNSTRHYLNKVIETMARYPKSIIEGYFERLCNDKAFSYRMRSKFKAILDEIRYDSDRFWD